MIEDIAEMILFVGVVFLCISGWFSAVTTLLRGKVPYAVELLVKVGVPMYVISFTDLVDRLAYSIGVI